MRRYAVLLVTLLTLSVAFPVYAGLDDAESAYRRKDYVKAAKEYKALAEQGNAEAQLNIGLMYYEGRGVPMNYPEAVGWLRKASEQGIADAQLKLGLMYDKGQGLPKDSSEAVKWFLKAAEQGMSQAQYNLGLMYHEGEGVPKDLVQAYMWFELAAAQGSSKAQMARDKIAAELTPSQIAEARRLAREWKPQGQEK